MGSKLANAAPSGAAWIVIAGFLFAWMGVFVKQGARYFSTAELVFYRSLFGLLLLSVVMRWRGYSPLTPHWRLHLRRSSAGFFALAMFFYALAHLPLATAVTLNYTSPLFLAILLALWYRQRLSRQQLWLLLAGFAGVALLLRPSFQAALWLSILVGLGSALCAAIAFLNVRQLGKMGEPEWRVVFYFTLVCSIGAAVWMLFEARTDFPPSAAYGVLLGLGTSATFAQLALTRAYSVGQPLVVATLAYCTPVFASLLGWWLWQETLPLSGWLAMSVIIVSGASASYYAKQSQEHAK